MSLMRLNDAGLSFGTHVLLDKANWVLQRGERIALVGRNGAGKSTLLKVLAGEVQLDGGDLWRQDAIRVAYMQQDLPVGIGMTVRDYVATGLSQIGDWLSRYQYLTTQAMDSRQLAELDQLQHRIDAADGWRLQQRIDTLLQQMQLPAETDVDSLSGGWRRRAVLARALVNDPDVLLLDEPTNHLDIVAIDWLEKQLQAFSGSLVFITHDRTFLQKLATGIVLLDRGHLTTYPGNYQNYLATREHELEVEATQNALFDKRLAQEEVWIRQGIKARRTRNEGRVRALIDMRRERAARREQSGSARMVLEGAERSGKRVIEASDVRYAVGDKVLFDNVSVTVQRGDRIALVGPNGVGKTTLLRLLLKELEPDAGTVEHGTKLEIAYFDQARAQLDLSKSVMDNLAEGREFIEIGGKKQHAISYLEQFLFAPERSRTPVSVLSGGERNRLLIAKLFSKPANLLVLDEPTNDLDIETLELLEESLHQFEGTVLMVSHDRQFIDNLVTSCWVIAGDRQVGVYVGGYSDCLRQGGLRDCFEREERSAGASATKAETTAAVAETAAAKAGKKLSYKLQRELDGLPQKIDDLEQEVARLSAEQALPEFYSRNHVAIAEHHQRLTAVQGELDAAYERWQELESM
jgi:ATP-binding cassette subfamily F protein uup